MTTSRYALAVDTRRCIGCWSCSVACKLENNVPDEAWYNTVLTVGGEQPNTPAGQYGSNSLGYVVMHCQHCDNPACVSVCPTGATYKDTETGIVMQNTEECIGDRACVSACPYSVRTFLEGEPTSALDWPVGNANAPEHVANTVEKCTMCAHRVAAGDVPACVEGCPARARFFGDLNDPESDVSKLLAEREYTQMLPEESTGPNVYYLA